MNCCNDEERRDCGCINEILKKILMLQKEDFDCDVFSGCDKPYLGPTCRSICYNTRPITLYNCCNGSSWEFPYTLIDITSFSSVFRIEALDDCCATFRILYLNTETNQYTSTNEFFTIDLSCVGAIKCLPDTYVEVC